MKSIKLAIAIILALAGAFFLMKAFFWALGIVYTIIFTLISLAVVIAIALPIFFIIKKKFLK